MYTLQQIDELAGFSDSPAPSVTRILYSEKDVLARRYCNDITDSQYFHLLLRLLLQLDIDCSMLLCFIFIWTSNSTFDGCWHSIYCPELNAELLIKHLSTMHTNLKDGIFDTF